MKGINSTYLVSWYNLEVMKVANRESDSCNISSFHFSAFLLLFEKGNNSAFSCIIGCLQSWRSMFILNFAVCLLAKFGRKIVKLFSKVVLTPQKREGAKKKSL